MDYSDGQGLLLVVRYAVVLYVAYYVGYTIYTAFFGPLAKFPGPILNKISAIPKVYHVASGEEPTYIQGLHEKYGAIVRTRPNELMFLGSRQTWSNVYGFGSKLDRPLKDRDFYATTVRNNTPNVANAIDQTEHMRQRRILQPAFSGVALQKQETLIMRWAQSMRDKMVGHSVKGDRTDMLKLWNCTTFDIMAELVFGEGLGMLENEEYSLWVKSIFEGVKSNTLIRTARMLPITRFVIDRFVLGSKKVRAAKWRHYNWTIERADKRRTMQDRTEPDIWTLIAVNGEESGGMTLEERYTNSELFMFAGTETSATALSGITFYLCTHPEAMRKVCDEVRHEFTNFDDITAENLAKLEYLNACIKEGLRLYPPVPSALPRRTPPGGTNILGTYVPGDVVVCIQQYATYRSPANFTNPNKFVPERWLPGNEEYASDNRDCVEPFGFGPRVCLGISLAWFEIRLLLATALLHFDLELAQESVGWIHQKAYSMWEKVPLWCYLRPVKV